MENHPRIENWSVVLNNGQPRLEGKVYNHPDPRHPDGKSINTSPIDFAEGNVVRCNTRSYELGTADAAFAGECAERGIEFDPEKPANAINAMVELICPDRPLLS